MREENGKIILTEEEEALFDNAKSNLDAPIIGSIIFPQCENCKAYDPKYGTWDDPTCTVFGDVPWKYVANHEDCPEIQPKE